MTTVGDVKLGLEGDHGSLVGGRGRGLREANHSVNVKNSGLAGGHESRDDQSEKSAREHDDELGLGLRRKTQMAE